MAVSKITAFFDCNVEEVWNAVTLMDNCNWRSDLDRIEVIFGAEPKDYEVLEFINRNYYQLQFSPAVEAVVKDTRKNPKRAQRDAKKQTLETGIGTKSQQALKLQQEQNKQERKVRSREQREAENRRLFELKQIKKREKHKGH